MQSGTGRPKKFKNTFKEFPAFVERLMKEAERHCFLAEMIHQNGDRTIIISEREICAQPECSDCRTAT